MFPVPPPADIAGSASPRAEVSTCPRPDTPVQRYIYFTHFQTLTNNTGSPVSPGASSHLLTMLLSLLAWGILESSPFTLILVGDCTLRCSGSMDCWQVDMGM